MVNQMWFGTRDYMTWVPAPAVNIDSSKVGWNSTTNYLNGGAAVRRSIAAHKEYDLSWSMKTRAEIRVISDFADRLFGMGAIYWADPFAMDANMLPQSWAAPFMGGHDGIILSGKATRPMLVNTPGNANGYPTQSAVYTIGAEAKPSVWIPIPPGYTAWVGASGGNGTGGRVVATPTTGPLSTGAAVNLTLLPESGTTRVNQSFSSTSYDGVLISLGGAGTVTLSGIIVQLLPTTATPATGAFISGQGHSGCQFTEQPTLTQYNAVLDKVGLNAQLTEVEQWR